MLQTTMYKDTSYYKPINSYNNIQIINPNEWEIWYADLGKTEGSLQGGIRPVLIKSNSKFNMFSPIVQIIPISSQISKKSPVHVLIDSDQENGLVKLSIVLVEQMTSINKFRLKEKIGILSNSKKQEVTNKMKFQFGIVA